MEFLGRDSEPQPHQLGSLGERCDYKLYQWGLGQSPWKFVVVIIKGVHLYTNSWFFVSLQYATVGNSGYAGWLGL